MQEHTTLIPHLTCRDAEAAYAFYQKALGAQPVGMMKTPDGRVMHASLTIDGCPIYLNEEFPEYGGKSPALLGGSPVTIHLQVADCDAFYDRAIEAGCTVGMPMQDQFWGDRYGMVVDPFGHKWSFATTKRILTPEEIHEFMMAS